MLNGKCYENISYIEHKTNYIIIHINMLKKASKLMNLRDRELNINNHLSVMKSVWSSGDDFIKYTK